MTSYILRRMLALIPTIFIASAIVFFTLRLLAPVDFIEATIDETPGADDPVVLAALRAEFGLDKPVYIQYALWMWGAVRADMGTSWSSGKPVMEEIAQSLPVSLELTLINLALSVFIGVPLGIVGAIYQNSKADFATRFYAVLGLSVPGFVVATALLLTPAVVWGWSPPIRYMSPFQDLQQHALIMVLPVIALSASISATQIRMLRSTMLEVLRMDYVRTARAKGLEEQVVVSRHALKNALIPVVTILGVQVSASLGGAVVIEQIFSLPGLGRLTLYTIQTGDFPQLQANVLYFLLIFLVFNLIVDISYAWLDPRIRYQ